MNIIFNFCQVCSTRCHDILHSVPLGVPCPSHRLSFSSSLSATFNTVNHQVLLATLAELRIADSALYWFTSYLTNRTYQVTWNGSLSKPLLPWHRRPSRLSIRTASVLPGSLGSVITLHGLSYHCYADDTLSPPLTAWLQLAPGPELASAPGRLHTTWSLTSTRLSSSSCRGRTAHTWTYW